MMRNPNTAGAGLGSSTLWLLAAGCVATPAVPQRPPGIEHYEVSCDASRAQNLVGRIRSPAAAAEALRLSGAVTVRWIGPGDGVSSDHNSGRVNLEIDTGGRIIAIRCD
jgi:hypothetical protein